MKDLLILLGGIGLGYAFNTEAGKNLRSKVMEKAREKFLELTVINLESETAPTEVVPEEK